MKPHRTTTGLLLVVCMAFAGFLLLYLPQWSVDQYNWSRMRAVAG